MTSTVSSSCFENKKMYNISQELNKINCWKYPQEFVGGVAVLDVDVVVPTTGEVHGRATHADELILRCVDFEGTKSRFSRRSCVRRHQGSDCPV